MNGIAISKLELNLVGEDNVNLDGHSLVDAIIEETI